MSSSDLTRWGGLATIAGGVLFVVSSLFSLAVDFDHFSEAVTTGPFAIHIVSLLLSTMLLLGGLVALYAARSETAAVLGLVGFLMAFVGTALLGGLSWAETFVLPSLASVDPGFLDAEPSGVLGLGQMLTVFLFALGWLLYGVAALRGRLYPRLANILLIIGAVLVLFPLPVIGFINVVFGVAVAWLGFALLTGRGATAEQPSRVS
jgi:hypothetical protein